MRQTHCGSRVRRTWQNRNSKQNVKLPTDSDRLLIVGQTGSGKTVAAAWHLSVRSWDVMPWIVFDFKGERFLNSVGATPITISAPPPTEPGLYIVKPIAERDDELVDEFLWRVWSNENTGLYFDEGFMIPPRSKSLTAILTQGRSKHIPLIFLSQRPTLISRFAISESQFYQVFHLQDKDDRTKIERFLPRKDLPRLARFNSYWYDVSRDALSRLQPVPRETIIRGTFQRRMEAIKAESMRAREAREGLKLRVI